MIHINIHKGVSMRTNIVLDEALLQEAFHYANVRTEKEIVHLALKEFVENARKLSR